MIPVCVSLCVCVSSFRSLRQFQCHSMRSRHLRNQCWLVSTVAMYYVRGRQLLYVNTRVCTDCVCIYLCGWSFHVPTCVVASALVLWLFPLFLLLSGACCCRLRQWPNGPMRRGNVFKCIGWSMHRVSRRQLLVSPEGQVIVRVPSSQFCCSHCFALCCIRYCQVLPEPPAILCVLLATTAQLVVAITLPALRPPTAHQLAWERNPAAQAAQRGTTAPVEP
jgi:hypothetical protein